MTYQDEILEWRRQVEESLRGEESWLSLAGLFWLSTGEHSIGTAPESAIRLPQGTAPSTAGCIHFDGTRVSFAASQGVEAYVGEQRVASVRLQADTDGQPTHVRLGDVTFIVIRRGTRWGLRIWNRKHPARSTFRGRRWFPIDESFVVSARYVPYDPPRPTVIANALGDSEMTPCPRHVEFGLRGTSARLLATEAEADSLFLLFADPTNGLTTYPAGRFLVAHRAEPDAVTLDFNRAYNPPCAFTPYATCPLPPAENRLAIAVEAGEQYDAAWHNE